uniref:NADH:ubiquinone reductase (H(+)-translocating) n=1 Tax=Benedenia hoshinai TaxID=407255 RepID=E1U265_BENHO|nr:NADH dehydrogenase subunit 5 [Benedenia hoshinai]ABK58263.1 NADH dehydrogenase subunit 5 [Benedenia hoshinai]
MLILFLFFCLLLINTNFVMSFNFFNGLCNSLNLNYYFSSISNICLIMLLCCGIIALYFSLHYYNWEFNSLNSLIIFFLSIMCYLVLTNNFYNSLIAWEYLGVVSFILILYYSNYDTARAANITLVSSRFGDVGLFILLSFFFYFFNNSPFYFFSILLIIITKSAIIPFSSWLLEAMRAPTPVSCLVHSSTLVAAGIWFTLNYNYLINSYISGLLIYFCLITILFSSLSALFLLDVKKLVALSTCNNVSWCFLYYFLGNEYLCLIQLLSHGVAKCMLFCSVGDLLSCSNSNQFNSGLYNYHSGNLLNSFLCSLLTLFISGLPFLGVFFSKHLLITHFYNVNSFLLILLVFLCILFTYVYSFRLFMFVSFLFSGQNSGLNLSYNFASVILVCSCLFNYTYINSSEEFNPTDYNFSYLILLLQVLGSLLGIFCYRYNFNKLVFYFLGQDLLVLINNKLFNFVSHFFFIFSSFRFERFINNISFNINLFNFNFNSVLLLIIMSIFSLISLCIF